MEVTIQCPHCQTELEAPAELEGKPAICPTCQEQFIVKPIEAAQTPDRPRDLSSNRFQIGFQTITRGLEAGPPLLILAIA